MVLAATQFAVAGWSAGRISARDRLRRTSTLRSYRAAAEIVLLDSQLHPAFQGNGTLWRVMEVDEVVEESADCRSFYLVDPYGQPLPEFRPGQYLMVRPAIAGAFQATRCYSLSSSPDSRYWRITVKRQQFEGAWSRTRQGGLSAWLHDNIQAGDCLLVGGPSGHFYLPTENQSPLVLLAAGVGITPLASMLRWSMEHTPRRPVVLLFQARDLQHWPLGAHLHQWVECTPHCRVITFFSRLNADDRQQLEHVDVSWREGKFTAADAASAMSKLLGDDLQSDYFMCGPDGWMEEMRNGLLASGVAEANVHWESFGGAAPATTPSAVTGEQCHVRFSQSGAEAVWDDPDQTLWELAKACEVYVPSGCLSGVCGSCRVKVLSGDVAYDRAVSVELADGECLSCIARPQSDLVIDA